MTRDVNGWEQTYDIPGEPFCRCAHWIPSFPHGSAGETEQACCVSCHPLKAVREGAICRDA